MNTFIKNINELLKKEEQIKKDILNSKKVKNSSTINNFMKSKYPELYPDDCKNTNKCLLIVWNYIINKASKPRNENSISRLWIKLFQTMDKLFKLIYTNKNTISTNLGDYRKPIRNKFGQNSEIYKQSVYLMGLTQAESLQRREDYSNQVKARNADRESLDVFFDDDIYKVMDQTINSSNPQDRIVAVILAVGSRLIEVLKVSKYEESKDNDNFIKITGIAKDRGNLGYEDKVIIRPIIRFTAKQIIEAVDYIRKNLTIEGDNSKISDKYNSSVNKRVKKYLNTTSHKLRAISARLSYLLYGRGGVENTYVQEYLGHSSGEVSKSYQNVNVKLRNAVNLSGDDVKTAISELKEDSKMNKEEHKELEKKIDKNVPVLDGSIPVLKEFKNPRTKRNRDQQLELLRNLFKELDKLGYKNIKQSDIKRLYGYGSSILTEFWKEYKG